MMFELKPLRAMWGMAIVYVLNVFICSYIHFQINLFIQCPSSLVIEQGQLIIT